MDLIRDLISLGRNVREEAKIKVRQPINEVVLDGKNETIIGDLVDLIKEELNVKNVIFENNLGKYMNYSVKPNFKVAGPIFGANMKLFTETLANLSVEEIEKLNSGNKIQLTVADKEYDITRELVDIRISSKEGFNVAEENNNFIILDIELTEDLIKEGIVRELISKVQNLRKEKDFEITDRITLYVSSDEYVLSVIDEYKDMIQNEVLALEIINKDNLSYEVDLNGNQAFIDVEVK